MHELERYELEAGPAYRFEPDRREFFQLLGGGLLVFLAFEREAGAQRGGSVAPAEIGAWLHIGEDGGITAYTGKTEVGQNIRTSLAQAVADELRTSVENVRLVMADTDLTPYDAGTFGSRSTPYMAPQMRKAAAAAREMLLDLAAREWNKDRSSLMVADGQVRHEGSGTRATFAQLTKGQRLSKTIAADAQATPVSGWTQSGRSVRKVNARDIVTGRHEHTTDLKRPGMLHGRVLRPPALQSKLVSADLSAAERMTNVTVVRDGDFIGAAASDAKTLDQALAAVRAEWRSEPQISTRELYSHLKAKAAAGSGGRQQGDIEKGLFEADHKLESTYTIAYIAHVPLEPRAAVAEWNDGRLTVWTGTQRPFGVRTELARAFNVAEERVRVIVPDTGSAYGGKHSGEAAIEAARIAKAAGKPVKLIWTREEEFQWAYCRPAGVIHIRSGARKDGTLTAWEFHNYNSGGAAIQTLYDVPNQRIEFHRTDSPLRQGSYRALAATANHFARESHMDELAHAVGMEPLAFRLKNMKDQRFRNVLEAAAEKFGWNKRKPGERQGFGIAGGFEKGSYVATCAEVSVPPNAREPKIERLVVAFECGAIVNPVHLKSQVEGCVIMGIGAMFEEVEFAGGRVLNGRLSQYRVPRFSDVPPIDIVLLDRKDLPSAGAGETPIVGVAPAVANAVFAATGNRSRSLPMRL